MHTLPAVLSRLVGSLVDLNRPGHYVHWGFIQISVANLVVIGLMVVVFVAAILIPFRRTAGVTSDHRHRNTAGTRRPGGDAADRPRTPTSGRAKVRHAAVEALPPAAAHARPPAGLRGVLDLRIRRPHPRRPRRGDPTGWSWPSWARPGGTSRPTGLFVNSLHLWSVEVFFFAMVDPPVGQVLHGRLARQAPGHLDHRRGVVRRLGRRRLHRLPVPAELRLPVDQHPGQGRDQLHRCRRHLQRHQLRPDAHVAHRPPAARAWCFWSGVHVLLVRLRGVVPPFAHPKRRRATPDR